jgi:cytoskeletal protein RodZ
MGHSVATVESARSDFGNRMKRLREERGVTLRQIADATKISLGALEALERNDISRLPGGIFSRAFVRSYALEVGLDPEQTVRDFLAHFPDDSVTAGSPHAPPEGLGPDSPRSGRATTLVAVVVVAALLVGVVLFLTLSAR